MRFARPLVGAAAAALLVAGIVGLITRDDGAPSGPGAPGEVSIAGFAFGPESLTVKVGATVTWTNQDGTDHTVDSNGAGLDSDSLAKGDTYEHTFDAPGTFTYFCAFHPFMKGTVEVTG